MGLPTATNQHDDASGPATAVVAASDGAGRRSHLIRSVLGSGYIGRVELAGLAAFALAWLLVGQLVEYQAVVSLIIVYTLVCSGLVLLFGVAGQLSLGQALFIGAGAVVAGDVSLHTAYGLEIEIVLAAAIGFLLGLIVGLPSLRVAGLYLAIATFAIGFAGQHLMLRWDSVTGGGQRINGWTPAGIRSEPDRTRRHHLRGADRAPGQHVARAQSHARAHRAVVERSADE